MASELTPTLGTHKVLNRIKAYVLLFCLLLLLLFVCLFFRELSITVMVHYLSNILIGLANNATFSSYGWPEFGNDCQLNSA